MWRKGHVLLNQGCSFLWHACNAIAILFLYMVLDCFGSQDLQVDQPCVWCKEPCSVGGTFFHASKVKNKLQLAVEQETFRSLCDLRIGSIQLGLHTSERFNKCRKNYTQRQMPQNTQNKTSRTTSQVLLCIRPIDHHTFSTHIQKAVG